MQARLFSVGPGVTWADHQYMATFFTITRAQAAVSPLRAYTAHAGIDDLHMNAVITYQISSRWGVAALAWLVYKIN